MSIRKSEAANQRHRRRLGLRVVGISLVVLVGSAAGVSAVMVDDLRGVSPGGGDPSASAPVVPAEPEVVRLDAVRSVPGESSFEGVVGPMLVAVLPVESGSGLATVEVAFRHGAFVGELDVAGTTHRVSRGGGTVHATVPESGVVEIELRADSEVETEFRLSVVHPSP